MMKWCSFCCHPIQKDIFLEDMRNIDLSNVSVYYLFLTPHNAWSNCSFGHLIGLCLVVPTYSLSCDDEVQESSHLFGGLPKDLVVFVFPLYVASASLSSYILSTCSLHCLFLLHGHLTTSYIPSLPDLTASHQGDACDSS